MSRTVSPWRSLKTRVTLLTLAIFVVGLWSLAFYSSRRLRDDMQHLLGDQQFSAVTFVAGELNHEVVEMFGALGRVAGRVTPALLNDDAALQAFLDERLILKDPFNGGVVAYRRDGTAIAHGPRSAAPMSANAADSDAVRAVLTTGEPTVGRPVMDSTGQAAVFSMAVPIRDARGAVIGALAGMTNLARPSFLGSISSSRYGRTGAYSVVATKYRLIFASGREDHRMVTLPESGAAPLYDRIFAGYEGSTNYVTPTGEQRLASAKGVPAAGWVVTTALAADEVFAPVRVLQQRVLLAAILLTLLAGGLAWWMLWRAFRPLEEAERMLELASGSSLPPVPLPVVRRDEIGRLMESFNRLLARLTEREALLLESEARYRGMVESAFNGSMIHRDGVIVDANMACATMYGYALEELRGMPVLDLWAPECRDAVADIARSGSELPYESIGLRKDGSRLAVEVAGRACAFGGRPARMVAVRDISGRTAAEAAMHESEERFRVFFERSNVGVSITTPTGEIEVNRAFGDMLGYSQEEMQVPWQDITHPEDVDLTEREINALLAGERESTRFEKRYLRKDGSVVWVDLSSSMRRDASGAPLAFLTAMVDITERKRSEAMHYIGARLGGLSDGSPLDEVLQFAVDEAEAITGSHIGFVHFLDPDQTTLHLQMWSTRTLNGMCTAEGKGSHYPVADAGVWADCVATRTPLIHNDYASLAHRKGLPPGHAPIIRELVVPLLRDGLVVMILGVGNKPTGYSQQDVDAVSRISELVWDVVKVRRTAEALRQSEATLRSIFATMSEGVALNEVVYDARGEMVDYRIVLVNEAFYSVADYGDQRVIGNVATRLYGMSPAAIAAFWQSHRDREDVQHTEFLSPINGRWFYISTSPIVDHRFVTSFFDITDRMNADALLHASLREKEALLKEVHHRVKNNLQVITSLLRLEAGRSRQPDTKSVLADMQGRIQSMALLHESLYRTGSFAEVDLGAYLRRISAQAVRAFTAGVGSVSLRLDVISVSVNMDQAIPCGLLVNELVSNCFKHSFPDGRSGDVLIELQPLSDGAQLRLRVSDTGVGLPADFDERRNASLGLQLAGDLAVQLGGRLEIGPGPAAVFSVTFAVDEPAQVGHPVGTPEGVSSGAAS